MENKNEECGDRYEKKLTNADMYGYISQRYQSYNLGIRSSDEMVVLLNILEAHGETLENIANFTSHAIDNIFKPNITQKDIADTLLECNAFFSEENFGYIQDMGQDSFEGGLKSGQIIKTTNGYVEINIV